MEKPVSNEYEDKNWSFDTQAITAYQRAAKMWCCICYSKFSTTFN